MQLDTGQLSPLRELGTIAVVHETLAGSREDVVAVDDVLDQVLPMLGDLATVGQAARIARSGDFGELPAGTATPLGVVPAGTGNDFAAAVGVPADPLAAAGAIARGLAAAQGRRFDLARMTGPGSAAPTWFGAVLAAGFDAIVNERANRMRWPRGPRRYDVAIVAELARLRARTYTMTLDGVTSTEPAVLVAVGNTASYGGGLRVCPDADPTDGLLDVVIGRPMSRFTLTRIKPRLYTGTHVDHPLVVQHRARTVVLDAEGITTYADGERALPLPVTVTAVPGALTLVG